MTDIVQSAVSKCEISCKNNADMRRRVVLGVTKAGDLPGEYWQIDFAELPGKEGYWSILVLVDTFSGWLEAFPCHTNAAKEGVKVLLDHIILRFGFPLGMSSERELHFVTAVAKEVSRVLGITWDLHTPYRLQVSGKIERMNGTLKTKLANFVRKHP